MFSKDKIKNRSELSWTFTSHTTNLGPDLGGLIAQSLNLLWR